MHTNSLSMLTACLLATGLTAQIDNLRITEVDAAGDLVEVTNVGPAFVTPVAYSFSHRSNQASSIPAGTSFGVLQVLTFTVTGLDDADSDLWLYRNPVFTLPANVVHGVKYGPAANVGNTSVAVAAGLWPSPSTFMPAAGNAQTLGYDGFGSSPHDWFVDASPSMGLLDPTSPGSVNGGLVVPVGSASFENVPLGDSAAALLNWVIVDTGAPNGDYDIRAIGDVNGVVGGGAVPGSTRWLRLRDQDDAAVQNRFYANFLNTGGVTLPYRLEFWINPLELPAPSAGTRPRIIIQHGSTAGVQNMWGIEMDTSGAKFLVLAAGGPVATLPLGGFALGQWHNVVFTVTPTTFAIALDGAPAVSAPIAPGPTIDLGNLRFCYRGEGAGNAATVLIDQVSFRFGNDAQQIVRLGTPANPNVLLPGLTHGPQLGQTWDPVIQASVPGNVADLLAISLRSTVNVVVPGVLVGTLLLDPTAPELILLAQVPAQPFAVAFPNNLSLMGLELSSQGASLGTPGIVMTNALDLVIGN